MEPLALEGFKIAISLDPVFWTMLRTAVTRDGVRLAALVARIDAERIKTDPAQGLAGAIRVWLVTQQKGSENSLAAP
ncbi:aryl-sulfate sulfotransferase [Porphyrobacter algicida]|uniref:Aryl-sulfate sulfotransferase n=1 Tax=Qipengyuania algicida TaxID=1836209 RepID=A0A845AKH1_9SPHN|nr:ribbon-helix-helix domain-containing protein [Qipengyuania algicida]MXP29381.1 aryl-sulfate sulfotransferase [Qipengyuania algicida]